MHGHQCHMGVHLLALREPGAHLAQSSDALARKPFFAVPCSGKSKSRRYFTILLTEPSLDLRRGLRPSPRHWIWSYLFVLFFPRARTPCGHGAQIIIEGREIQSDGGEEDKDNPTNNKKPKPTTTQRPSLHHPVVFPLY